MSTYTLNCWVRSNDPEATFPVNISKTDIVYDLQEAIKNVNPATFGDVDADALALYKPKDPLSKPYKENLGKFILAEHGERLCGLDELSEVFPEPPSKHEIHIIVDAPSEIICYLRGSTLNSFFPIPLQPGEGIGRLSLRIMDAQPNLRSHLVRLYKISGDENELRESLKKAGDGELLFENPLMSSFLDVPVLDPLRVVVESPEGALEGRERKRKRVDDYSLGLMFPLTNLTSYNDNGIETSFTYTEQINENKLVFSAVVNEPGAKECIVKFTSQYSEAAHEYLASHGMAPKIWKCIQISADWIAVVMEKSKYQVLYGIELSKAEEEKVKHKVTNIVQTLHAGEFVHGDIRDSNLLIDRASLTSEDVKVHLIDFDWAGRVGEVKYPEGINCKTVKRPKGVKAGELITQQHDDEMVSNLFRDEPFCPSSSPTAFAE